MNLNTAIRIYTLLVNLSCLAVASIEDVRKREVSNNIWKLMVGMCLPAVILYIVKYGDRNTILHYTVSSLLVSSMAIALYLAGLIMGGDAKCIIALSLSNIPGIVGSLPIALLSFMNGAVMTLAVLPLILLWNVYVKLVKGVNLFERYEVSPLVKILCPLVAIKIRYGDIKKHIDVKYALVETMKNGRRVIRLGKLEGSKISSLSDDDYVWAMPLLPFIVFILAGYVVSIRGINLALKIAMKIMSLV
ncbi:MAG: hypothetical protein DRJ66_01895 [Thermoprotei archaeon]|mgnify:CR=1 FL=1|nr:MAG: hypothetical protein DRJ66_01895 [Thermoprotei archaeon]RLF20250.1 MAG: hypothetical protein DRZ82_02815 [Thermoprotei archaeon]